MTEEREVLVCEVLIRGLLHGSSIDGSIAVRQYARDMQHV